MIKSKYREGLILLLDREFAKSVLQLQEELQDKHGKVINWHFLYKLLRQLESEGICRQIKSKSAILWIRT